ncbi:hypothetical protein GQ44DRAFT_449056 [Phaeosphaeriaceae sp. PMI808]|nr:hypothetical protein GQ44DRAFT_449056 [Phaeosphaeriaceae sp. PMI808]
MLDAIIRTKSPCFSWGMQDLRRHCSREQRQLYHQPRPSQLRRLTSDVTCLDRFVLPPPRITETVPRAAWLLITSAKREFVFIHRNLARHSIMISPETLEVTCIFDWEHAGCFPPELEADAWRMKHSEYFQLFTCQERIQRELELIAVKGRLPPCMEEGLMLRSE